MESSSWLQRLRQLLPARSFVRFSIHNFVKPKTFQLSSSFQPDEYSSTSRAHYCLSRASFNHHLQWPVSRTASAVSPTRCDSLDRHSLLLRFVERPEFGHHPGDCESHYAAQHDLAHASQAELDVS